MITFTNALGGKADFGPISCAPGALGFCGEGYPSHKYLKLLGLTWKNMAFASKTLTTEPHIGNMVYKEDGLTPRDILPSCIIPKPWSAHFLNAVKLTNRGVKFYMDLGLWQKMNRPFYLSWTGISEQESDRLEEAREFVRITWHFFRDLRVAVALQINCGCPSNRVTHDDLLAEIIKLLEVFAPLEIPLILNFSPIVPVSLLVELSKHPAVSAFWIANTIPWGWEGIDWKGIFGTEVSPLIKRGFKQAGGLSGPTCLPFTLRKVRLARGYDITLPIIAGNGIQCANDVLRLKEAGATGIAVGCVALMRPYRMKSITDAAYRHFV